ncbi:glycerol-3-phosphate 1-O-acyltransferase PlsY [Terriglobus tenax]|uniref:glycerol-3-phosphate 1-O-acyltransferase PlsY n=1 Tax=Terriglobus tenax TaxID=1111115 RepID=UPI0021DFD9AE|nr:glycerol-3-phosphate 1-O-acyltransferase PlsY [Terriglobus tenax]
MNPWLLTLVLAYLLGSIPFGYILVRLFLKQDIRATGSGNTGATNVARSGKKGLAIATLLLDLLKGVAAVLIARYIAGAHGLSAEDMAAAAAAMAIIGHIFPVWLGFRGGKGVATGLGVFLAISPLATLCCLAIFIVVFALWKYVSMASILAAAAFPVAAFLISHGNVSAIVAASYVVIPAIIIFKHHSNIQRLLQGKENRFGSKKKAAQA